MMKAVLGPPPQGGVGFVLFHQPLGGGVWSRRVGASLFFSRGKHETNVTFV